MFKDYSLPFSVPLSDHSRIYLHASLGVLITRSRDLDNALSYFHLLIPCLTLLITLLLYPEYLFPSFLSQPMLSGNLN